MKTYARFILTFALLIITFTVGPWLISAPSDMAVLGGLGFLSVMPIVFWLVWRKPKKPFKRITPTL